MNCTEWKKKVIEWERSRAAHQRPLGECPPELKAHIDLCSSCRARYEALILLEKGAVFSEEAHPLLPAKVSAALTARFSLSRFRRIRFPGIFLPSLAAAAAAVVVLVILALVIPGSQTVTVTFVLEAPGAESVAVVGDWNKWDPTSDRLSDREGDGVWKIELTLNKNNEYRYQFLIDGDNWIPDPHSRLKVEDGFGGINSVLEI